MSVIYVSIVYLTCIIGIRKEIAAALIAYSGLTAKFESFFVFQFQLPSDCIAVGQQTFHRSLSFCNNILNILVNTKEHRLPAPAAL